MRGPFLAALQRNSLPHSAVLTPTGETSVDKLCALARAMRSTMEEHEPGRLVATPDIVEFVKCLLAFDGACRVIHICPSDAQVHPDWAALASAQRAGLANQEETSWFLATSGTTGTPKLVRHSFETLTANTKPRQQGAPLRRWGMLYEHSRFAGMQVVLQALLGGATLCAAPLNDLPAALQFYKECGVTSLSATPTLWRKILMIPSLSLPSLRQITLGGEIADQSLLDALANRFSSCTIRHIYASTEAGVGFSVADGRSGFPASYLESSSQTGVEIRISEASHLLIRRVNASGKSGADALPSGQQVEFLDTGDIVKRDGDRVYFLGRSSGAINVGGNKVHPEAIEAVLCAHAGVNAAKVYGLPNSIVGSLVMADVVPSASDPRQLEAELRQLCAAKLAAWQRPVKYKMVQELPVSSSGKVSRVEAM